MAGILRYVLFLIIAIVVYRLVNRLLSGGFRGKQKQAARPKQTVETSGEVHNSNSGTGMVDGDYVEYEEVE